MGRVNESGGGADAGTMVRPVSTTDGGDARSGDRLSGGRGDDDDHVPDGKATAGEACRRQARIIRALSVASALNCTSWFMMIPVRGPVAIHSHCLTLAFVATPSTVSSEYNFL